MHDSLYNPLAPLDGKVHCNILFLLLVVSVIVLVFAIVGFGMSIFDKKMSMGLLSLALLQALLMHYLYRVLYSMCLKAM